VLQLWAKVLAPLTVKPAKGLQNRGEQPGGPGSGRWGKIDKEGVFRPLYNVQLVDDLDSPLVLLCTSADALLQGSVLRKERQLAGRARGTLASGTFSGPRCSSLSYLRVYEYFTE
jgi:hypothetical protein